MIHNVIFILSKVIEDSLEKEKESIQEYIKTFP